MPAPPKLAGYEGSFIPGWSVRRAWLLSLLLCTAIAVLDALLGRSVALIGLLAFGPCCALLTGRWARTALTGLLALGLAVALGVPDGAWGTEEHVVFILAVGLVTVATVGAAVVLERVTRRTSAQ